MSKSTPYFTWHSLSVWSPDGKNPILQRVNGSVARGEMIAIMGSSGAGKTSLLSTLSGRLKGTIQGEILVDGVERKDVDFKSIMGYVSQDDCLLENATVREILLFAAHLKLPARLSSSEIGARVVEIAGELGIAHTLDTLVGGFWFTGISGGERKRVSIAVELLRRPALLLLDEPTSGLDAFSARQVMDYVKTSAIDHKAAVICSIHQPRASVFQSFNKILLLCKGRTVYLGSPTTVVTYLSELGYPCPPFESAADHMIDTASIDTRTTEAEVTSRARLDHLIQNWRGKEDPLPIISGSVTIGAIPDTVRNEYVSVIVESKILLRRALVQSMRNYPVVLAIISSEIVSGLLLGLSFFRIGYDEIDIPSRLGCILIGVMIICFWSYQFSAGFHFLYDKVYHNERAAGMYRVGTQFITSCLIQEIIITVLPVLAFIPAYFLTGMWTDGTAIAWFAAFTMATAFASYGVGTLLAVACNRTLIAYLTTPLIYLTQLLLAGYFVPLNEMNSLMRVLAYMNYPHYAFCGIGFTQLNDNPAAGGGFFAASAEDAANCSPTTCESTSDVIELYSLDRLAPYQNLLIILAWGVVLQIATYLVTLLRGPYKNIKTEPAVSVASNEAETVDVKVCTKYNSLENVQMPLKSEEKFQ